MKLTNKQLADLLAQCKAENRELKQENGVFAKSIKEKRDLAEEVRLISLRLNNVRLVLQTAQAVKFPDKNLQYFKTLEPEEVESEQFLFLRHLFSLTGGTL